MSGTLYIVGTPIGNLEDMTYRAVRILSEVDFICAEDTRVTIKLLNHFEIKKPLISYHEHSPSTASYMIAQRVQDGENCAVVTDAGMPCISDPGFELVKLCRDMGVKVESVPGPTAIATAAAICGMPASRFSFEGFLSVTKKQRSQHLNEVAKATQTLIFYEAPHKLLATLKDMLEVFGDRNIALCRELTKLHEEVKRTTLSEAINYYSENNPKGEFVLVIEGYKENLSEGVTVDDAIEEAKRLVDDGMKPTDASKEIAKKYGFKKADIYAGISK